MLIMKSQRIPILVPSELKSHLRSKQATKGSHPPARGRLAGVCHRQPRSCNHLPTNGRITAAHTKGETYRRIGELACRRFQSVKSSLPRRRYANRPTRFPSRRHISLTPKDALASTHLPLPLKDASASRCLRLSSKDGLASRYPFWDFPSRIIAVPCLADLKR